MKRMRRRPGSNAHPRNGAPARQPFTAADVRRMLSDPAYAYGIYLLPAERVAEEVMRLNEHLAREVRETGATFTLDPLEQRLQELLRRSECKGLYSGDNG